jgi:hypothetical protein
MTSRVLTPRVLALAAAAALAGTPLLIGSPAGAQAAMPTAPLTSMRSESAGTVTFNGGCGLLGSGLGGKSTPDATRLSVPAGSGVRFANRLGQAAALLLNGAPVGEVPAGGAADVVFREGPVTASMQLDCMLGSPAGTVTIEVRAAPPPPSPSASPVRRPPRAPAGTPATADTPTRSESPATGPAAAGDPAAGGPAPGAWWPHAPAQRPAGQPADGAARSGRDRSGQDGELGGRWGNQLKPADGGDTAGDPATVEPELADDRFAVQPMSRTAGPASDDGPIGLLALIATVCVVGVSAGAIRALVTQRANRAEWA